LTQCHSYSGARIQLLEEKTKEHWSDDSQNYEAVIIHAGTNNLVNESPHQVAQRMEAAQGWGVRDHFDPFSMGRSGLEHPIPVLLLHTNFFG
jgi:hypothetical protein